MLIINFFYFWWLVVYLRASVTIGVVGRMLVEELLQKYSCAPSPPEIQWVKERWFVLVEVARKLEQSQGSWWNSGNEGKLCAILGACLIQAQDYFVAVERDALEERLEIDCLKTELL